MVTADLLAVKSKYEQARVPVELVEDYLKLQVGDQEMRVRIMADPGHPDRVHLRSVTPAGEVTVSTQRVRAMPKLVEYTRVLIAAANRQ